MPIPIKILKKFKKAKKPVAKKRPTVGSHCLTSNVDEATWILMGVPDDRGVKNNFGRVGASKGPDIFREFFFSHSVANVSPAERSIFDLGNLKLSRDLKSTLDQLKEIIFIIKHLMPSKKILIIGGGHDIAFSEVAGCLKAGHGGRNHHVINIDAHSDVRPLENGRVITSGTPFYRLMEEEGLAPEHYHPFGLQRTANSKPLVQWMNQKGVIPYWLEDMPTDEKQIQKFQELMHQVNSSPWHFSIDMDGFPASIAPGVSAPGVFGVTPQIFLTIHNMRHVLQYMETMGIYELNPKYDVQNSTARLAAKIAYLILSQFHAGS